MDTIFGLPVIESDDFPEQPAFEFGPLTSDSLLRAGLWVRVERLATRTLPVPFPDGLEWFDTPIGRDCQCARCGSSVSFTDCWNCGGIGYSDHDCGEDCCACLHPTLNVTCDFCRGKGSFGSCISGPEWCEAHPLRGREHVRSTATWEAEEMA